MRNYNQEPTGGRGDPPLINGSRGDPAIRVLVIKGLFNNAASFINAVRCKHADRLEAGGDLSACLHLTASRNSQENNKRQFV